MMNFGRFKYICLRLINRRPAAIYQSSIDKRASVGNGAQIYNSVVGRYSYIFNSKVINSEIGQFCSIAEDCTIGGGAHPLTWVSTSPVFYSGRNSLNMNFSNNKFQEYNRTEIGNDVWIGSKCLIRGGVKIGDGAVIGMGSVVTHDVPAYEIWAGNPAKLIRKRFDESTIDSLKKIQWWDWSDEQIQENAELFNSPQTLINKVENRL